MEHLSYDQSLEVIAQIFKELNFLDDYKPSFGTLHQVLEYEVFDKQKLQLIYSQGGGEGGGEYCELVFKYNSVFYKMEYTYYSYHGFSFEDTDHLMIVEPVQRLVTMYE